MLFQELGEHFLAGGCAAGIGLGDHGKSVSLAELPSHFAPERLDRRAPFFPGLAGRVVGAVDHGNVGLRHVQKAGLFDQRRHAGHIDEIALPGGEVPDGEHRMRLAAAKGCLELDDRLATFAGKTIGNLREQQLHPCGDVGAVEERSSILVDIRGLACADSRDVGGKLGLLKRPLENVRVRDRDFTPGF